MKEALKVGLWIPPREDLNSALKMDTPANTDIRIYELYLSYLEDNGIIYYENLDFRNAVIKNAKVYIDDFCLSELDHFVWTGTIDRTRDSYHLEVLRVLELSVNVHNPRSFFNIATDKFSAFSILHHHNIPLPELYLVSPENLSAMKPLFENSSFLLKPRRSSFGKGIVKLDSYEQFRDTAEYHPKKQFYLEKFYENDLNDWTGVTVFNGTVLYGFRKTSGKISGWKVYDEGRVGGETIYVKPPPGIERVAIAIGKILGGNYYGLDFIKTAEGYKVVDINCFPGVYYDFIQELKIPIAERFFKMLPLTKKAVVAHS